jgi:glycine/serine hydroxymethyltransferase
MFVQTFFQYQVQTDSKLLDLDVLRTQKPTILLAGYSAYPRKVTFARTRETSQHR